MDCYIERTNLLFPSYYITISFVLAIISGYLNVVQQTIFFTAVQSCRRKCNNKMMKLQWKNI